MKSHRLIIASLLTFFLVNTIFIANANSQNQDGVKTIFRCQNDEAIVNQFENDLSRYQLVIKNNNINMYLNLGYMAKPEGFGRSTADGETFIGFESITPFEWRNPYSPPFRTTRVFSEYNGLKVLVETAAHYYCIYQPLFGDSSGEIHMVIQPLGVSCPNLYPDYDFRNASPGIDYETRQDWFFQNCQKIN